VLKKAEIASAAANGFEFCSSKSVGCGRKALGEAEQSQRPRELTRNGKEYCLLCFDASLSMDLEIGSDGSGRE